MSGDLLHGRLHRLRFTITTAVRPHRIEYRIDPGVHGGFTFWPANDWIEFEATLEFGWRLPVVAAVIDPAVQKVMRGLLASVDSTCARRVRI